MWEIARILPSLRLPSADSSHWNDDAANAGPLSLRTSDVRILPSDHPDLAPFIERFPASKSLLEGFRDVLGAKVHPSVLVVHSDSRLPRRVDVLAAFRNCVALAYVLFGRASFLADCGGAIGASWSDAFDFYPIEINKRGELVLSSPALMHWLGQGDSFTGAPSPYVDSHLTVSSVDYRLTSLLSRAWRDFYLRGQLVRQLRPVFRSLEIAYHAASVPVRNAASIHDFGLSLSLWVSALECLVHTGTTKVNQRVVLEFLAKVQFDERALAAKRYRIRLGRDKRAATAVQKACAMAYDARNRFLHGEPVSRRLLVPWPRRERCTTFSAIALVYRMALITSLEGLYPPDPLSFRKLPDDWLEAALSDATFETALCRFFRLRSTWEA